MKKHLVIILFTLATISKGLNAGNTLAMLTGGPRITQFTFWELVCEAEKSEKLLGVRADVALKVLEPELPNFPNCHNLFFVRLGKNMNAFMDQLRAATKSIADWSFCKDKEYLLKAPMSLYVYPSDRTDMALYCGVIALNCLEIVLRYQANNNIASK